MFSPSGLQAVLVLLRSSNTEIPPVHFQAKIRTIVWILA